jgi:hypothetical protein
MSQTVKVTKIGKSGKGKPIVYFDNRHGQTDGYLVNSKCYTPQEGMTIEADTASSSFEGKTFWWLNGWKEVKSATASGPSQDTGNGRSAPESPQAQPQKGWDIQSGDLSRYASNIVASAITAGLIKSPTDIYAWANAAYKSAEGLRRGDMWQEPQTGPDPSTHAGDPDDPGFEDSQIPF